MNENKVLFEETILLTGDEESINKSVDFITKKVGDKNVCFFDVQLCERSLGYLYVVIRATEEVFKDIRFHLDLEQVWG